MDIQKIKIEDLKESSYNPRKITDEQLKKLEDSLDKFGYVEPIIWNKRTGNVVGGHQRFKVLRKKEVVEIECVVVDLDEYQEKSLNVALNKITGEFDDDMLTDLLLDIKDNGPELLRYCGFEDDELNVRFLVNELDKEGNLENRWKVITVEPPEAPRLKERVSFYCEKEEDYKKIKEYFGGDVKLDLNKLLGMLK